MTAHPTIDFTGTRADLLSKATGKQSLPVQSAARSEAEKLLAELERIAPRRDPHGHKLSVEGDIRDRLIEAILCGTAAIALAEASEQ